MDNPETSATPGTQYTGRRQPKKEKHNTTQKTKKMSNTDPNQNRGVNPVLSNGKQFLPLIKHCINGVYLFVLNLPDIKFAYV
jgi:hypothetical protein